MSSPPTGCASTIKGAPLVARQSRCHGGCSIRRLLRVAVLLCGAVMLNASAAEQVLHYASPAPDTPQGWEQQALPIGNGRLGAMLFGQVARDRLQFNDITLWTGDRHTMGAFQPFGDVVLTLDGADAPVSAYRRELDIARAVNRLNYTQHGVRFTREALASHPAQVIAWRLTADRPGRYHGRIALTDRHGAALSAANNTLTAVGALPNGMAYASQLRVVHEGGSVSVDGNTLRFNGVNALTLILGAGTSFADGQPPLPRVQRQVAAAPRWAPLRAAHERDVGALLGRVTLDLGTSPPERRALSTDARLAAYTQHGNDPELEALYFQFGRYLLVSSSRDSLPANLQGLWNDHLQPPWNSDYHSNINLQMNYWPAEVTHLAETARPFHRFVQRLIPAWRQAVSERAALALKDPAALPPETPPWDNSVQPPQETFLTAAGTPVRGWALRTETNPFGHQGYLWNMTGNAWYARHFWEHYAFTQDRTFLRAVAWPVLREVGEFWEDRLKTLPDGRLVAPNGWSPEHGPIQDGVAYDQQILWDHFDNLAQAAELLGEHAARDRAVAIRDRLAGPRVGSWGQLLEWMEELKDPVLDTPRDTHRHVSHLYALYPGRQISPTRTPALAAAARTTLTARGDVSTGWSMAWKIAFWARLHDGNHAHELLRGLLAQPGARKAREGAEVHQGGTYPNLLDTHPPFQIDGNFGATAAIAEMLLQSHEGVIALLPALPAAWGQGSVRGLRARGGFVVDIAWAQGRVTRTTVRAVAGAGGGRLRVGERVIELQLRPGQTRTLEFPLP
ncbi:glycoside hydrolase family 95 protein [Pelomonas sp. UHG3]|uniref:Glycoside hydrolase family 95 protein n=1 Tax=Roseateles hydrophilus TaxID=2975054 RepID=A0ACC6CAC0_9BURK|nr:glycoside hydrolase family 95 protein [Pelomonas sp. UHG3]MCY4745320.1 glycoside hydrolase family 95 protein [Pelomonas sp. UHG3]